jgi:hypothetical protein
MIPRLRMHVHPWLHTWASVISETSKPISAMRFASVQPSFSGRDSQTTTWIEPLWPRSRSSSNSLCWSREHDQDQWIHLPSLW